ncbi:hypothetical protein INT48_001925 [Thamnidium elegans]|uniref:Uncharacterized protein n=1 Tax=Thamnidium elegans TaxID=101142 RepID=A0A8H7VZ31_9FUNG|nr:hypothetical protein INT48_001925 [Thamnidium elegans]
MGHKITNKKFMTHEIILAFEKFKQKHQSIDKHRSILYNVAENFCYELLLGNKHSNWSNQLDVVGITRTNQVIQLIQEPKEQLSVLPISGNTYEENVTQFFAAFDSSKFGFKRSKHNSGTDHNEFLLDDFITQKIEDHFSP